MIGATLKNYIRSNKIPIEQCRTIGIKDQQFLISFRTKEPRKVYKKATSFVCRRCQRDISEYACYNVLYYLYYITYDFVSDQKINPYGLQLISLLNETLGVEIENVIRIETPYGIQLRWILPQGMPFAIHLKDNLKVRLHAFL